jgi:hypothetical protein
VAYATGVLSVSTLTLNSTHSVSGLSFTPKCGRFWIAGRSDATDTVGSASHDWCEGIVDSALAQRTLSTQSFNGNTTMGADATIRDDCIIAMLNHALAGGTDNGRISLLSWDATGFTVKNITALSRAVRVSYEVWGGSDITNAEVITITEPGSTGNSTVTLVGAFRPDMLRFLGSSLTSINSVAVDSWFCTGAASGVTSALQWTMAGGSDDALGTSNTDMYIKSGECVALHQATPPTTPGATSLDFRASVNQINSDGFQLNVIERAASRLIFCLAIKGGQWAAGKLALANTANAATNAVTGLGFQPIGLSTAYGGFTADCTADTPVTSQEFGMGAGSSASSRHCQWITDDDAATSGTVRTGIAYASVAKLIDSSSTTALDCDITSFDAGGFTLDNQAAVAVASNMIGYVAMAPSAGGGGAAGQPTIRGTCRFSRRGPRRLARPARSHWRHRSPTTSRAASSARPAARVVVARVERTTRRAASRRTTRAHRSRRSRRTGRRIRMARPRTTSCARKA